MRNFSSRRELAGSVRNLTLALGATAALAGGAPLASAQTPPATFSAYPMPGTVTVSPSTDISFRGAAPAALGTVTVTGSKSGAHPGTLIAHSDGLGASFRPAKGFSPGEEIT